MQNIKQKNHQKHQKSRFFLFSKNFRQSSKIVPTTTYNNKTLIINKIINNTS